MGCEEDVSPFESSEFPFTLWGLINPRADTQAVRVFTIEPTLTSIEAAPLDASVSIINTVTQQRHVLQDSITLLPNGEARHTYWSVFDVDHNERYFVEVERSDGARTVSTPIEVPPLITITPLEPNTNSVSELILPLEIGGDPPSMPRIDAAYSSFAVDPDGELVEENPVVISYATRPQFVDGIWRLEIDIREDFRLIREDFNQKDIIGSICTGDITLSVHVGNEEWQSPVGVFDPNILVEPGTLSNVENGFGFFGAGYVETVIVEVPLILQVRAGFADCTDDS